MRNIFKRENYFAGCNTLLCSLKMEASYQDAAFVNNLHGNKHYAKASRMIDNTVGDVSRTAQRAIKKLPFCNK